MSIAVACLVPAACGPAEPQRPNVLLIVVDTLRADRLGCYGQARETSPSIDGLAAKGYRFERAYSTAPWTMPSVASVFTGLYPSGHGVQRFTRLPEEATTVAEILAGRGYATGGVVSHLVLTEEFNFQQGFERYKNRTGPRPHFDLSTDDVTTGAGELLAEYAEGDRPFFLFAHYFDPHYNYRPHDEVDFAAPRAGRLDGTETIQELRALSEELSAEELGFIRDLYDEEIRHTDDGIGRLLEVLERLDLDDNTWVVVTADHGEEFLEHGWLGHTRSLYQELVRVPLVIRPPGGLDVPRRIERLTSLVSLTPTILEIVGLDPTPFAFHAASIAPLFSEAPAPPPGAVFAEVDFEPLEPDDRIKRTAKKAVITGRLKLVRDELTGEIEIYDLVEDPLELRDLSPERQALIDELLPVLEEAIVLFRGEGLPGDAVPLTEERMEQLRSLGYVGR